MLFILTSRVNNRHAFTLLELIVVISLIGTILFFAIPRLDQSIFSDDSRKVSRWILVNVDMLKRNAIREQRQFSLNADIDNGRFWISNDSMPPESIDDARQRAFELPSGFRMIDLMYPDGKRVTGGTEKIRFYPKGYSDRVILHLEDDRNRRISYFIEPFLSRVEIADTYATY